MQIQTLFELGQSQYLNYSMQTYYDIIGADYSVPPPGSVTVNSTDTGVGKLGLFIPKNCLNLLDGCQADAYKCFTQQWFSSKLQVYLMSYNISISGEPPQYG